MPRLDTFTFRVNQNERKMLAQLSKNLQRSQSDVMRLLVHEAHKRVNEAESQAKQGVQNANAS